VHELAQVGVEVLGVLLEHLLVQLIGVHVRKYIWAPGCPLKIAGRMPTLEMGRTLRFGPAGRGSASHHACVRKRGKDN
jgi:hypothetical protein